MVDFSDRVCIVAGGGHGIGEATAKQLADLGATVVVNDLGSSEHGEGESEEPAEQTAQDIRDDGGEAMAHFGDVADLDYTQSLVEDTFSEYGRIDACANFAGILRDRMTFNMSEDEWDIVIDVHLKGHFSLLRNLSAHWREQSKEIDGPLEPKRSFLAVSSESALGSIGQINYSAAKAGILGLTRTGARDLSRYGVRVNSLMPRAFTRLIASMPENYRPDEEEMPGPDDLAPLNAYLLSEAADDDTGVTFLNGGETIGLVSDPEVYKTASRDGGWTPDLIEERFDELLGQGEDLEWLD